MQAYTAELEAQLEKVRDENERLKSIVVIITHSFYLFLT